MTQVDGIIFLLDEPGLYPCAYWSLVKGVVKAFLALPDPRQNCLWQLEVDKKPTCRATGSRYKLRVRVQENGKGVLRDIISVISEHHLF